MNRHPSFNEELAAHLDGKGHPLPWPQTGCGNVTNRRRADIVPDLAASYDRTMIDRRLVADGFLPWHGRGACPVPDGTQVDVVYPDGFRIDNKAASDVLDWRLVAYYRETPLEPRLDRVDVVLVGTIGAILCGFAIALKMLGVI